MNPSCPKMHKTVLKNLGRDFFWEVHVYAFWTSYDDQYIITYYFRLSSLQKLLSKLITQLYKELFCPFSATCAINICESVSYKYINCCYHVSFIDFVMMYSRDFLFHTNCVVLCYATVVNQGTLRSVNIKYIAANKKWKRPQNQQNLIHT